MLLFNAAKLDGVSEHPRQDLSPDPAPPATLEAFLAGVDGRAFRFAEVALRHRDDALDVVQDAMLKMLGYRQRPITEWSPLFWSILRNRITDARRRNLFRLRWLRPAHGYADGEPPDWADSSPGPSRTNDSFEAWTTISAALGDLPTRQREAFTLRVLEQLDVADTARAMGCSEGSVKTHLSRARAALQKQLEDFR